MLPALPLLFGWLVLAVASANDAYVAGGSPGRVLLEPRPLLWLVVAVIAATMGLALLSALQLVGG